MVSGDEVSGDEVGGDEVSGDEVSGDGADGLIHFFYQVDPDDCRLALNHSTRSIWHLLLSTFFSSASVSDFNRSFSQVICQFFLLKHLCLIDFFF